MKASGMPIARQTDRSASRATRPVRTPRIIRSASSSAGLILNDFSKPKPTPSPRTSASIGLASAGASASVATDWMRPAGVAFSCASYSRTIPAKPAASSFAMAGRMMIRRSSFSRVPKRRTVSSRVLFTWQTSARNPGTPGSSQRSGMGPRQQRLLRQVRQHLLERRPEQPAHLAFVGDRRLVAVALQHQLAAL